MEYPKRHEINAKEITTQFSLLDIQYADSIIDYANPNETKPAGEISDPSILHFQHPNTFQKQDILLEIKKYGAQCSQIGYYRTTDRNVGIVRLLNESGETISEVFVRN